MNQMRNYKSCIADCTACANHCRQCASACLEQDDAKKLKICIQLNNDCADICELAVRFMLANSPFANRVCNLCEDICNACAIECEKHANISQCEAAANACRACAIVCLEMTTK